MDPLATQELRTFIGQCLSQAGDADGFGDQDSLFVSGRLDSLALTRLVLFLETRFGIDFGVLDFSAELVDTVADMQALIPPAAQARRTA